MTATYVEIESRDGRFKAPVARYGEMAVFGALARDQEGNQADGSPVAVITPEQFVDGIAAEKVASHEDLGAIVTRGLVELDPNAK